MFSASINNSPYVSDAANAVFDGKVMGQQFVGTDCSMLSTLRALLFSRIPENEAFAFHYNDISVRRRSSISEDTLGSYIISCAERNSLTILNFDVPFDAKECFDMVDKLPESQYNCKNYQIIKKVENFYAKSFNVKCMIDVERKSSVVFIDGMTPKKLHFLQCGIPAYLPWYFPIEMGLSTEEMALINSLKEKSEEQYINCIAALYKLQNIDENFVRSALNGFETYNDRLAAERLENQLQDIDTNMDRLYRRLRECRNERSNLVVQSLGVRLRMSEKKEESELMEYFLTNKNIELASVENGTVRFRAKGYFMYFDTDAAETIIDNDRSFMYNNDGMYRYSTQISPEDMKILLKALFVDVSLRMKVCATYVLGPSGVLNPPSGVNYYGFPEFSNCVPNPHIQEYSCLGDHRLEADRCIENGNFIGAVEQLVASCASLNVSEAPTMTRFMQNMYKNYDGKKCIELPDGKCVTIKEAIAFLKEQ